MIVNEGGNEHAEIIKRGIDNRMDVYKLGFLISQIVALTFLTIAVLRRNKLLRARFKGRVKLRLEHINREAGITDVPISLTDEQKKALGDEANQNDLDLSFEKIRDKTLTVQKVPAKEKEADLKPPAAIHTTAKISEKDAPVA